MNTVPASLVRSSRAAAAFLLCASAAAPCASAQNVQGADGPDAEPEWILRSDATEAALDLLDQRQFLVADASLRFEPPEPAHEETESEHPLANESDEGPSKAAADDRDNINELAKKLNNPIASLISVPFQFNYDKGYGPKDGGRITLNIQPVIPFSITEDWNLILRTIVPVIWQDAVADGVGSDMGIGDTTQSFFFSPKEPIGGWIIGAGPVALWPTGTDPELRSENVGLGPTIVALRQHDGWTYGILANHIWSIAHSDDYEAVNSSFLQPFISYTWPTATTLTFNTESTYDWNNYNWTVPLNLMVSQVLRIGGQPISLQLGGRYYADSPGDGPEWGLRFTFTLLFPN